MKSFSIQNWKLTKNIEEQHKFLRFQELSLELKDCITSRNEKMTAMTEWHFFLDTIKIEGGCRDTEVT